MSSDLKQFIKSLVKSIFVNVFGTSLVTILDEIL